ncbi:MAG TPA: type III-A CRISPR-associated RAMP protein Csm3 [Bacteroidales bacterium]|nr:type III-A CRISPR-associated RAMP protein Csm3 [Bacteroidales bacterium]
MDTLIKKIKFEGKIVAKSGLHIGGTNSAMAIGGPDSTVIRNPIDNKPYIPGSSLKGKMRALIEIADGTIDTVNMGNVRYAATQDMNTVSARLFGSAKNDESQRPSKLIVRDGKLLSDDSLFTNTDLPYSESKTEVVIDRITSKAMPRQLERVPAGAEFRLDMVLNIFDGDNEKELIETVMRGLRLVQDDYLGGSGSRGSGQVEIVLDKITERPVDFYKTETGEEDITNKYSLNKN